MEARGKTVTFSVHYLAQFGQTMVVSGSNSTLGAWNPALSPFLNYSGDGRWVGVVTLAEGEEVFEYKYVLVEAASKNVIRWEEQENRRIDLRSHELDIVELRDLWQERPTASEKLFRTAAFKDVIFRRPAPEHVPGHLEEYYREAEAATAASAGSSKVLVRLSIAAPRLPPSYSLYVCGSSEALGSWTRPIKLYDGAFPVWKLTLLIDRLQLPLEYKYVIKPTEDAGPASKEGASIWESGSNRILYPVGEQSSKRSQFESHQRPILLEVNDQQFRVPALPRWKAAGVAVPVFSLRSRNSFGVGEFLDIKPLVDWAVTAGLQLVQLLPVNDTSIHGNFWDSYPYSSLSVFALNPLYLHLPALSRYAPLPKGFAESVRARAAEFDTPSLEYEGTWKVKKSLLREAYEAHKSRFIGSRELTTFLEENRHWLPAYALFSRLRDVYGHCNYSTWPHHRTISQQEVEELTAPSTEHYEELAFYYYLQYHAHQQLLEASEYAKHRGVILKGDLPIGVDPLSVDTWLQPHLFRMHCQTGAPPDYFAPEGQNWGFPTYDWDAMAREGYAWWKHRLAWMARYFHAYRIDHVLGFFRIWEIPGDAIDGIMGHFRPSVPLSQEELEQSGLWDIRRLSEPYIRWHLLNDLFGKDAADVASRFLDEPYPGIFAFKPQYSSEKKIEEALTAPPGASEPARQQLESIKRRLFRLITNVVLLRDGTDPRKFYPRFFCQHTTSYQELPEPQRWTIDRLYHSYFNERQDVLWRDRAMQKLPMMQAVGNMLVIAEDLGLLPKCVQGVLDELFLLGLRIQRMPKDTTMEFDEPRGYPYLSVCSPSVHDTSNLREWWEENRGVTQRYFNYMLHEEGEAPRECEPWVIKKILDSHLNSPAMWAVFPLQDLFALSRSLRIPNAKEERINDPSVRHHNWKFRMHITLEDLTDQSQEWSRYVRGMVANSGRLSYLGELFFPKE